MSVQKGSRSKSEDQKKVILVKSLKNKPKTKVVNLSLKSTKTTKKSEVPAHLKTPSAALLKPFKQAAKELKKKKKADKVRSRKSTQSFLAKAPRKGKKYSLDLRINSFNTSGYFKRGGMAAGPALSRLCRAKGVDTICLTNYYSASHLDVISEIDPKSKIRVLPGLDLSCQVGASKEVHFIAIFKEETTAAELENLLDALKVPAHLRGKPGHILNCSCKTMIEIVEAAGGILIPTEVDKTPSQALAIPILIEQFGFHAFDLVSPDSPDVFKAWPEGKFSFFSFSNALSLAQIGSRDNLTKLEVPGFEGIARKVARRNPS